MRFSIAFVVAALLLAACSEEEVLEKPEPQSLTREAVGYFCGMIVADHEGPKGQVILQGRTGALWFSSVRDTLAYTRLPEEIDPIAAIYVSDISRAMSWEHPGAGAWVEIHDAIYVVGSTRKGGMGAPEIAPFSDRGGAKLFAERFGGTIMTLSEVPDNALLGSWENDEPAHPQDGATQ